MTTKTRSGIGGKVFITGVTLGLVAFALAKWPHHEDKPHQGTTPAATIDAAPAPGAVQSPAQVAPSQGLRNTKGVLFFTASWTKKPPSINYFIGGTPKLALPQEQGPWAWTSNPILVQPGVQYFMTVGGTFGDYGVIRCAIEVDGNVVTNVEPRDTSQDPGAIRCTYKAP